MNVNELPKQIIKGDFSFLRSLLKNDQNQHPAELSKIIQQFTFEDSLKEFLLLPEEKQIAVFPYLDLMVQKNFAVQLPDDKVSHILNAMRSDDRTTFYSSLSGKQLTKFLEYLNEKNKRTTHDFIGYPKDSVARLVNTDFADIELGLNIGQAIDHLRKFHKDSEAINVIYVIDKEGKLVDDIPIRRLLLNDTTKKIDDILDGFCAQLLVSDTKETAVAMFKEYDRTVLPVVNAKNILIGVITVDDVLDVDEQKSTTEIQKFGGVESLDYPYVQTPFISLIKKRAGWLIILFLGEMLTASAMGYFDVEISRAVVLALFIPLIISSGGNSGSQAATLIIRAMALKELSLKNWWYVMRREILSGLTLGVILGFIGFIRIITWQELNIYNYGEHYILVAFTIFLSLIGIVMWGTLNGAMIPMFLKKFGFDPAASSAPFVATLVDVTGLVIYFSIAAVILKGTLL